jgi:hypothetical protein
MEAEMGRWNRSVCQHYAKDNSPKAQLLLRLTQKILERPDCIHSAVPRGEEGTYLEADGVRYVTRMDSITVRAYEIWEHYSARSFDRETARLLIRGFTHVDAPVWCSLKTGSHISFYDKRMSDYTLRKIHALMPLEALAYYG